MIQTMSLANIKRQKSGCSSVIATLTSPSTVTVMMTTTGQPPLPPIQPLRSYPPSSLGNESQHSSIHSPQLIPVISKGSN